jgi:hypothetical protein
MMWGQLELRSPLADGSATEAELCPDPVHVLVGKTREAVRHGPQWVPNVGSLRHFVAIRPLSHSLTAHSLRTYRLKIN